jgi:hypothetical protein
LIGFSEFADGSVLDWGRLMFDAVGEVLVLCAGLIVWICKGIARVDEQQLGGVGGVQKHGLG